MPLLVTLKVTLPTGAASGATVMVMGPAITAVHNTPTTVVETGQPKDGGAGD